MALDLSFRPETRPPGQRRDFAFRPVGKARVGQQDPDGYKGRDGEIYSCVKAEDISILRDGENPARWRGHLDKLLPKRSKVRAIEHHPALPWPELPAFMGELAKHDELTYKAMRLTILTACRTSEALGATWAEIDLETRT